MNSCVTLKSDFIMGVVSEVLYSFIQSHDTVSTTKERSMCLKFFLLFCCIFQKRLGSICNKVATGFFVVVVVFLCLFKKKSIYQMEYNGIFDLLI